MTKLTKAGRVRAEILGVEVDSPDNVYAVVGVFCDAFLCRDISRLGFCLEVCPPDGLCAKRVIAFLNTGGTADD